jgi:hypothetical protein
MSKQVYKQEVEKLQKFKRDLSWFRANYEKIDRQFKGQHVAILHEQIIDNDVDYHNLLQKLRHKHHKNPNLFLIEYVNDRKVGYIL